MTEELKCLYEKLYQVVSEHNNINGNHPLTICPAIPGYKYFEGDTRIMVVGRAINGWCPLSESIDGSGIRGRVERCEKCSLDWVTGKNTWGNCKKTGCPFVSDDKIDGRSNRTPFWQMVEYVYNKTTGCVGTEAYEHVVWSNLYKASYQDGGNPTGFYKEQVKICNAILVAEIKAYNPTHIFFITETYRENPSASNRTWFCETYPKDPDLNFGAVYEYIREHAEEIKVSVLMRPEFRTKDELWKKRQDLKGNTIVADENKKDKSELIDICSKLEQELAQVEKEIIAFLVENSFAEEGASFEEIDLDDVEDELEDEDVAARREYDCLRYKRLVILDTIRALQKVIEDDTGMVSIGKQICNIDAIRFESECVVQRETVLIEIAKKYSDLLKSLCD